MPSAFPHHSLRADTPRTRPTRQREIGRAGREAVSLPHPRCGSQEVAQRPPPRRRGLLLATISAAWVTTTIAACAGCTGGKRRRARHHGADKLWTTRKSQPKQSKVWLPLTSIVFLLYALLCPTCTAPDTIRNSRSRRIQTSRAPLPGTRSIRQESPQPYGPN